MARIAIDPNTLDIREFRPGLQLQQKGYIVIKDAADLADKGKAFLEPLSKVILGKTKKLGKADSSRLNLASKIWPDVVLKAVHNRVPVEEVKSQMPVEEPPRGKKTGEKREAEVPADEKMGRGNHKPRIPHFTLTGVTPSIQMPPQAEILAIEFNNMYARGVREVKTWEMKDYIKGMKLPTSQDKMRIFRYYYWLVARAGVIKPEGEMKTDVVVRQNAQRHKFEASLSTSIEVELLDEQHAI